MPDHSIRFCIYEGPGTLSVGTLVGGLPLYFFASLISSLESPTSDLKC